jgi:hypothetical protein
MVKTVAGGRRKVKCGLGSVQGNEQKLEMSPRITTLEQNVGFDGE